MKRKKSKSELDYRERQLTLFFYEHLDHNREDRDEWKYAASKLTKIAPENFNRNDVEVGKLIRERNKTRFENSCRNIKTA